MLTADFDYALPENLIAQQPLPCRDKSRLLVLNRKTGRIDHQKFESFPNWLKSGDVLVLNDSRVIPARLQGENARSGGQFELLLLEEVEKNQWWVMVRPGKRAREGTTIRIRSLSRQLSSVQAEVIGINAEGHRLVRFSGTENILKALDELGEVPLPPYIRRKNQNHRGEDRARYQTVFARSSGSVAAPTAGLHFSPAILEKLRERGVAICFITLHVGLGTFAPVKALELSSHTMHEERIEVTESTAKLVNETRTKGGRIIAAGTTAVRVLESVGAANSGMLAVATGRTRIFIRPPFEFKMVDGLLTNFHLPRSTLLMLVSAFAAPGETRGIDLVRAAYQEAIREKYRFFSYGDAMLLL